MRGEKYVLIKDRVPREGKGVDSLLTQLGAYMRLPENKLVQKILVDASRLYIYFEKLLPKEDAPEHTELTFHDAIRKVQMAELVLDKDALATSSDVIKEMFLDIARNEYEASHALIGAKTKFYSWTGLPRKIDRLFGLPIHKVPELPEDVLILCGAATRECDPEDIQYSIKWTMP